MATGINNDDEDKQLIQDANVGVAIEGGQLNISETAAKKALNTSAGAIQLRNWLNKCLRIEMSDGRVLIGIFLCTDRDANVILGSCTEYLPEDNKEATLPSYVNDEPRMLGLVMVPGKHIVTICIDENEFPNTLQDDCQLREPLLHGEVNSEDVM